jgi:hypothetical protein
MRLRASSIITLLPASDNSLAAIKPDAPAPIIIIDELFISDNLED